MPSRRSTSRGTQRAWVATLARAGLVAVGLSYGLVAVLALLLALGAPGAREDRDGALARIASTSWGIPFLIAVAAGFAAYSTWRLVRALLGANVENAEDRGWAKRAVDAVRGLLYAGLAIGVVRIAFGARSSQSDEDTQTATVLHWPGGRILVVAIGLGFAGAALWNIYRGAAKKYEDQLKTWQIPRARERAIAVVAHYGLFTRALLFGLIGWFLVRAAVDFDPDEAIGLDGALGVVSHQPFGRAMLAVVSVGLLAYALYRFVEARYREV